MMWGEKMNYFINIILSDLKRKKYFLLFFLIVFIILEIGIYYFIALKTDYNFFFGAYNYEEKASLYSILKFFKIFFYFYLFYYLTINDFRIHYYQIFLRMKKSKWLVKKIESYFIFMLLLKFFGFLFCVFLYHKIPPIGLLCTDFLLGICIIFCNFLCVFNRNYFFKFFPLTFLLILYFFIGYDKTWLYFIFILILFAVLLNLISNEKN